MFECPLCPKMFQVSTNLNHHMFGHTKEKPHKCSQCSAAFGRQDSLQKHIKSVHYGIKEIRNRDTLCPLCSYKCYGKSLLKIHMRKHSADVPFFCDQPRCGFKTKYQSALLRHGSQVHIGQRPYDCPTDGCSYKAKTRGLLRSHLKSHSSKKPFACKVPGYTYTCKIKQYLKGHFSRTHSNEKPFKCSTCNFRANSRPNLKQHQLTHEKVKRFQCRAPNCQFSSHFKSKLERHFDAKHRKKKDKRCTEPGCNYKCSSVNLLQVHLKKHQLPILKCPADSCSFSTKFKNNLVKYISRFHEDVQSTTMVEPRISDTEVAATATAMDTVYCTFPDCDYRTKFPHHYDRHRKTHNEEEKRTHVCPFCFSRFSHLCVLKAHVQRHVGEGPYSCSLCKYTTVESSEVVKHAKKIHHIRLIPCGKQEEVKKCLTCGRNCLSYSELVLHSLSHLQAVVVLQRLRL